MNILYLSNSSQIGGGNRSLLTLANGVQKYDIDPLVIVPDTGPMYNACNNYSLKVLVRYYCQPSWKSVKKTMLNNVDWLRVMKHHHIDIIHANDISTARLISLACFIKRKAMICHIRYHIDLALAQWAFKMLPSPDLFVFNSYSMMDSEAYKLNDHCLKADKKVVYNAVNLDEFYPQYQSKENYEKYLIGIVANLLPVKGHFDFLKMAKKLIENCINAEFWLIGEDIHRTGYRQQLENFCTDLKINDKVKFLGHCSNMPELINKLDIVVCSSHKEPFGRSLIEAMACAKPVVATNVGGIPEVVEHGVSGFLVPPSSPEQLADAVQTLIENKQLREDMGKAGLERVYQYFSQESHIEQMIQIYSNYLRKKRIA